MEITKAYQVPRHPYNILHVHQRPPSSEILPAPLELLVCAGMALVSPVNHKYNVNLLFAHWSTRGCTRRRSIHINEFLVAAVNSSPFYKLTPL